MRIRILVTVLGALFGAVSAHAGLINGGFETGDLTGWTRFTTANGTLGGLGDVVPFDVDGDATAVESARFRTATAVYSDVPEGGGVFQNVTLADGALAISADIASFQPGPSGNLFGGLFELLFDGIVVDSHDFGLIWAGETHRDRLSASLPVSAGLHEIRLQMKRPFAQNWMTPLQFVDNVSLSGAAVDDLGLPPEGTEPVPEPGSLTLVGLGLLGLARARRRVRP
jgi:hypothetical protein